MPADHYKPLRTAPPQADSLVERCGPALRRYLLRRGHRGQEAQDLAQEVYLRLLRVGKAELARQSPAFLYWIASHVVYEFRRKARREQVLFDSGLLENWSEHPPHVAPDGMDRQLDLSRQLGRALEQLSPKYRAVLLLHKQDGMSYAEIASTLGISVHTVKKYLARALSTLRALAWDR